jgi:hypothetical protein
MAKSLRKCTRGHLRRKRVSYAFEFLMPLCLNTQLREGVKTIQFVYEKIKKSSG